MWSTVPDITVNCNPYIYSERVTNVSFLEIAKKRYSVRNYLPEKIEKEKLLKILEAGRVAPTGCNLQPYRLIVAQEENGLGKIKKTANIYGAPMAIIVCGDHSKSWKRPFDGKDITDIDTGIVTDHYDAASYRIRVRYRVDLLFQA